MADENAERDGDAGAGGRRADPVAARNDDLAQAGGPAAGEPAKGGAGVGSGGHHGGEAGEPSGSRTDSAGPPPSNGTAPLVHTAMDAEVRDTEEKARKAASP